VPTKTTSSKWAGVEGRKLLQALRDTLAKAAKHTLEKEGSAVPVVAICTADGDVKMVLMQWDDGEKHETYAALVEHARKEWHMEAAILVNDVHMASVPKDKPFPEHVSDLPHSVEALAVATFGPDWKESRLYPYERLGKVIRWHEEKATEEFESKLFSLEAPSDV